MKSLDTQAREASREGLGLLQRLRAGLLVPAYTEVREWACPNCESVRSNRNPAPGAWATSVLCPHCGPRNGKLSYEPEDLLRLLAFLGVEEARALTNGDHPWPMVETLTQSEWVRDLAMLCAKLPPKRVEVEPPKPRATSSATWNPAENTWHHDTLAENWLLVGASLAVARECHAEVFGDFFVGLDDEKASRRALDAAEAWVADPTPERRECWDVLQFLETPRWVVVAGGQELDGNTPAEALQAAAGVIGEPRVREVVAAEIVRRVLAS